MPPLSGADSSDGSCGRRLWSRKTRKSSSSRPEGARPRRKGIYLLPNLMTTGCLFSGFYGIVAAIDKHFDAAGKAVFVAMIFDTLDGRLARLTKTESAFGKEYDSLADMVAFGLAPAIIAYQWGVVRIAEFGRYWGRFGWLACFFYAAAAALRLARFNARSATADKRYFEGLPSPSAAAIVAAFIWFASAWPEPGLTGTHRRFPGDRQRRRADGEQLQLPELQAVQSRSAHQVRLHPAGAAVFRADCAGAVHDAVVHVWNLCAVGAGVVDRPPLAACYAWRAGAGPELAPGGRVAGAISTWRRSASMSGCGARWRVRSAARSRRVRAGSWSACVTTPAVAELLSPTRRRRRRLGRRCVPKS